MSRSFFSKEFEQHSSALPVKSSDNGPQFYQWRVRLASFNSFKGKHEDTRSTTSDIVRAYVFKAVFNEWRRVACSTCLRTFCLVKSTLSFISRCRCCISSNTWASNSPANQYSRTDFSVAYSPLEVWFYCQELISTIL